MAKLSEEQKEKMRIGREKKAAQVEAAKAAEVEKPIAKKDKLYTIPLEDISDLVFADTHGNLFWMDRSFKNGMFILRPKIIEK